MAIVQSPSSLDAHSLPRMSGRAWFRSSELASMPGGGVEAARALQAGPPVVIVAISAETSPAVVAEMVRAGAQGYLAKGHLDSDLPERVVRCVNGEVLLAVPTAGQALRRLTHVH